MKYFLIAGEASGDLHGAYLAEQIYEIDSNAEIQAWGGDFMQNMGVKILKHIRELAFMGFVEVLANLRSISKNFKKCKSDILNFNPDIIIFIDYPGFNIRMSKWAKKHNFKSVYFISPNVWAWKSKRVYKINNNNNGIVAILPFEKEFYKKYGIDVQYFGHPLAEIIKNYKKTPLDEFRSRNNLDAKPIIAVLPGSRKQELKHILPEILPVVQKFNDFNFVIGGTTNLDKDLYASLIKDCNIKIIYDQTYDLLANSVAGIIKSGTSTLEAALFNLPQVVCYKANRISVAIAKKVAKIKYISLVNIILNSNSVIELIQKELNPKNVENELKNILFNENYKNKIIKNYINLQNKLYQPNIYYNIANYIVNISKFKA